MTRRTALYCRVSTVDQHPENQEIELRAAVAQRGWELVEVYTDHISGAKARRPALDALLHDARRGCFAIVLVAGFDRLGRSVRHLLDTLDELHRCGVEFVSLREGIDTATPAGRVITTIIGAIAEFERALLIERVRCGMRRARLEGKRIGRKPLAVDRESVWRHRTHGLSLQQIAKAFGISKSSAARIVAAQREQSQAVPQGASTAPLQLLDTRSPNTAA